MYRNIIDAYSENEHYWLLTLVHDTIHYGNGRVYAEENLSIASYNIHLFFWYVIKDMLMKASHGEAFYMADLWKGETTGHLWVPQPKFDEREHWNFLRRQPKQIAEQTATLLEIWDAMTYLWPFLMFQFVCTVPGNTSSYPCVKNGVHKKETWFYFSLVQ